MCCKRWRRQAGGVIGGACRGPLRGVSPGSPKMDPTQMLHPTLLGYCFADTQLTAVTCSAMYVIGLMAGSCAWPSAGSWSACHIAVQPHHGAALCKNWFKAQSGCVLATFITACECLHLGFGSAEGYICSFAGVCGHLAGACFACQYHCRLLHVLRSQALGSCRPVASHWTHCHPSLKHACAAGAKHAAQCQGHTQGHAEQTCCSPDQTSCLLSCTCSFQL